MIEDDLEPETFTVLLTGFGPFLDVKINPSWEIVSRLPQLLQNTYPPIRIITQQEPLKASYHSIATAIPPLIDQQKVDVIIHVGLAVERNYYAVEKGANRDGYHEIPDVTRKVFTKAEIKQAWGKSPARLDSLLDFDAVIAGWKARTSNSVDVRASDDVGNYVCGFAYYLSLAKVVQTKGKGRVVFLHVPPLEGEREIEKGVEVTIALIKAIVETL